MHALLINEPPLQVLPSLAKAIGLNEALILQQIHYWLNPKHNQNLFKGRYWVYNTYEQWQAQF
ncbi:replication protein RepO, partial [Klebsiella pneumoniae]|nr:replication protein RepO [Klebsiella pneumoniae]